MKLDSCKINFLGDSITEGYDASEMSKCYWRLLEGDGAIVRGYGIAGTRISRQQSMHIDPKWDRYFRTRVRDMDPDADVIVIFGGVNDHGHGDAHIGSMDDRTDDTFYGALHNLYTEVRDMYPEARIVVMTPLHYYGEDLLRDEFGSSKDGPLKAYRDAIIEVAAYHDIPVLDLYNESGIDPRDPAQYQAFTTDGLHPNDIGHRMIYEKLKAFLLERV